MTCAFEETGEKAFETATRQIQFGRDPLEVVGVTFRNSRSPISFSGEVLSAVLV